MKLDVSEALGGKLFDRGVQMIGQNRCPISPALD
jgi:hypothetical protein